MSILSTKDSTGFKDRFDFSVFCFVILETTFQLSLLRLVFSDKIIAIVNITLVNYSKSFLFPFIYFPSVFPPPSTKTLSNRYKQCRKLLSILFVLILKGNSGCKLPSNHWTIQKI